jgi:hypothetical protein
MTLLLTILALALSLLLAACGDDDDSPEGGTLEGGGSEEEFCEAGDRLRTQISDLASFDVVSEGTDALEARLDEIDNTVDDLKESGEDVAAEEIAALETALDDVRANLDAIGGGQLTAQNATALLNSVLAAGTAAEQVFTKLRETCGE